jgi:hypothetical protein
MAQVVEHLPSKHMQGPGFNPRERGGGKKRKTETEREERNNFDKLAKPLGLILYIFIRWFLYHSQVP